MSHSAKRVSTAQPSVEIALEDAFWTLLADKPYADIKLQDVLAQAGVSKTSFYHYFDNLQNLADASIAHVIDQIKTLALTQEFIDDSDGTPRLKFEKAIEHPGMQHQLNRINLLASSHSTMRLATALRTFLRITLMTMLGISFEDDDTETHTTIEFVLGGLLSLIRRNVDEPATMSFATMAPTINAVFDRLQQSRQHDGHLRGFWNEPYCD